MKFNVEWDSYHMDGRKRARPPASTVHGWLTKMRGTLLDNENMRRSGIREMKEASITRAAIKKRDADRARTGKAPVRPKVKQPWLRLSFLRNRPTPVASNTKHKHSRAVVRYKKPSRSPSSHQSSTMKPNAKSRNKGSRTRKRSGVYQRFRGSAKKGGKK